MDTLDKYRQQVYKILKILQEADLLVEPAKSVFYVQTVEYLRYIISYNEDRMELKKVQAVKDWPKSTNVKEV